MSLIENNMTKKHLLLQQKTEFLFSVFLLPLFFTISITMKKLIFAGLFGLLLFLGLPASLHAQTEAESQPPSVTRIENYLQTLGTARARFLQTAPNGAQTIGTFYLNRPGKLRFEYDDPVEDFIVADGYFIYFYDAELGEQSNAPIGQTLADFLLRPDLQLSGDITVTDIRRGGKLLQVTLVQTEDPGAGSITLGFEEDPLKLKKWRVLDPTGAITEIELFKLQTGMALDDNLFVYMNPNRMDGQPHYND